MDGSPPGSPTPGILQARTLEWVAISFSNAWKWKVKVKSLSRVWLLVTPMDCSPPGYSAHRIFQARMLEWGAIAFSNMLAQCTHILHVMEVVHSSYGGWIVLLPKQRSLKSSQQHSYKINAISHLLIAVTPLRKKALSVPFKVLKLWMMRIITDPGSWGHKHWGFKFMTSPGSLLS